MAHQGEYFTDSPTSMRKGFYSMIIDSEVSLKTRKSKTRLRECQFREVNSRIYLHYHQLMKLRLCHPSYNTKVTSKTRNLLVYFSIFRSVAIFSVAMHKC